MDRDATGAWTATVDSAPPPGDPPPPPDDAPPPDDQAENPLAAAGPKRIGNRQIGERVYTKVEKKAIARQQKQLVRMGHATASSCLARG